MPGGGLTGPPRVWNTAWRGLPSCSARGFQAPSGGSQLLLCPRGLLEWGTHPHVGSSPNGAVLIPRCGRMLDMRSVRGANTDRSLTSAVPRDTVQHLSDC